MNVVFVNSFEKRVAQERIITAQVTIGERQGVWRVLWTEPDASGKPDQAVWFEGNRWQEMLEVFRAKLAEKTGEGYLPLIETESDGGDPNSDRARYGLMLQYYSETHGNEELYEKLRQWRKEQASREGKPSYLIATNRVLRMIACFVPRTGRELRAIPGFGERKSAQYGEAVLKLTGTYPRNGEFPLDWVAEQIDDYAFRIWLHKQKELRIKTSLEREAAKKMVLEQVAKGSVLADLAKTLNLPRREIVLLVEELEAEGYDLTALIAAELKGMPQAEQDRIRQAFEQEGDKYLKPVLQKAYSEEEMKSRDIERVYERLRLLRLQLRKEKSAETRAS